LDIVGDLLNGSSIYTLLIWISHIARSHAANHIDSIAVQEVDEVLAVSVTGWTLESLGY
jgi:hypothetical protein